MPWYLHYFLWILVVSLWVFVATEIYRDLSLIKKSRESEVVLPAFEAYLEANELLEKWQIARPLLRVSQCEYARSLVQTMIATYTVLLTYNIELDKDILKALQQLLDEPPPSHDPPPPTKTVGGGFRFRSFSLNPS